MNLDDVAAALLPEKRASDTHVYGSVKYVNEDGSYEVRLNASSATTRCSACCTAQAGDRVLVLVQANGRCAAVGRVGGDLGGGGGGGEDESVEAMATSQVTKIWKSVPFSNAIVRITDDQIDSIYTEG